MGPCGWKGSRKNKFPGESSQLPFVASDAPLSRSPQLPGLGDWSSWGRRSLVLKLGCLPHLPRCVVVLFNPRKHKQHHILNSSR